MSTRLSIIIPVLNEGGSLTRSLQQLQSWRAQGHEVIVVDGGSEDDTAQLGVALADKMVHSARGRARQMNAGAAEAAGDVLVFLHSDTLLPEGAAVQIQQALSHPRRCWGRFDLRLSGRHPAFRLIEFMINLRSRLSGVATGDQVIFVRSGLFRQLGGFPEIPLMEDVALSKTLRRIGWPCCLRSKVVTSSRRWENHGIVRTVVLMWRLRLAYFLGVSPDRLHAKYYGKSRQVNGK
ncbi:MAG: TIGR04283 family arsenosugar biosynthesis glycosyltransferase [Pseudomonadales bacterium]|nr:TIGR04283 family arsenosugar biosynthesis glycosyltransferase [Pseudomonadales bacterium]